MEGQVKCRIVRAATLEPLFPLLEGCGRVWLVCDRNVWDSVGSRIAAGLSGHECGVDSRMMPGTPAGRLLGVSLLDASEENKTLSTVEHVVGEMLDAGADRGVLVLGVGGGITTDIAGFAASVYKRGVRFAFVPTTLLAQVDAAIGGKNGVNFLSYKNMLGTIRQPEFTYICPEPLKGLTRHAFLDGVAEMLKTFLIADAPAYSAAVERLRASGCVSGDLSARAAEIKAGIVEQDPEEHGLRRVLNLGHTFAHAVEKLSGGEWSHGAAVSVGIVAAARLAESLDGKVRDICGRTFSCAAGLAGRIVSDFESVGLPAVCPYSPDEMAEAVSKDKKADGDGVIFILPADVGDVRQVRLTAEQMVRALDGRM